MATAIHCLLIYCQNICIKQKDPTLSLVALQVQAQLYPLIDTIYNFIIFKVPLERLNTSVMWFPLCRSVFLLPCACVPGVGQYLPQVLDHVFINQMAAVTKLE